MTSKHWELMDYSELHSFALAFVNHVLIPFDNPSSQLFFINLIAAFFMAVFVLFAGSSSTNKSLIKIVGSGFFRRKYWLNKSGQLDIKLYLINGLLKAFVLVPWLTFGYQTSIFVTDTLKNFNDGENIGYDLSSGFLIFATLLVFLWQDFVRFAGHWLNHNLGIFWYFHRVHHSARVLTPLTLFRAHPIEVAIATVRNSISIGLASGIFIFFFDTPYVLHTLLGVNTFNFLFNALVVNLHHSQIPMSFGSLEKVFVSPIQHQIHHSSHGEHHNRNYGASLAIWDLAIGSWMPSAQLRPNKLKFGNALRQQSLKKQLFGR